MSSPTTRPPPHFQPSDHLLPILHLHLQLSVKRICIIANCHGFTRLQSRKRTIFSIRRVCQINCNTLPPHCQQTHTYARSMWQIYSFPHIYNRYFYIFIHTHIYIYRKQDSHNNKSNPNIFAALHFGALRVFCKIVCALYCLPEHFIESLYVSVLPHFSRAVKLFDF